MGIGDWGLGSGEKNNFKNILFEFKNIYIFDFYNLYILNNFY